MKSLIQAYIFDLDGVLVDTAKYHYLAWKRLADELGIHFTEVDNERLKGVSRMQSLDIILEIGGRTVSNEYKFRIADKKNDWFVEYINNMKPDELFPGVAELLQSLRSKGYKVALASSSKNAQAVLKLLRIEHLFDVVVDGTMIKNSKPDPEIFLLAAKLLHVSPAECIVFEDAEAGVEAALRAGMKCIGIGSPVHLRKAHHVINSVAEFDTQKFNNPFNLIHS